MCTICIDLVEVKKKKKYKQLRRTEAKKAS